MEYFHDDSQHSYSTKSVTLFIPYEGVFEEDAFVCLVRASGRIVKYYISREYDLNTAPRTYDNYLPGRFIFSTFGRSSDFVQLHGLAEAPAKSISGLDHNVEHLYLIWRKRIRKFYLIYSRTCVQNLSFT